MNFAKVLCVTIGSFASTLVLNAAVADVKSAVRVDDLYQCVRASDNTVVMTSQRQDIVQAQCAAIVESTRAAHNVKQPTLLLRYGPPPVTQQPAMVAFGAPSASSVSPSASVSLSFAMLAQICDHAGSVGMTSCQVQPTRFDFPSSTSVVKSEGVWRAFGELPLTANVLVCSTPQTPGARADSFREVCGSDTYVAKSAVLVAPGQTLPPPVVQPVQPVGGTVEVVWAPPTANTDGSTPAIVAGYTVVYGATASTMVAALQVNDPKAVAAKVERLAAGNWCFAVRAVAPSGAQSALSNVACKAVQ